MAFASAVAMFVLVAHAHRGTAALADSRRASVASLEEDAPVLEVSLDAPAVPYPDISDLISSLDEDRRIVESSGMRDVRGNFSRALESAQQSIHNAVGELGLRLVNVSTHQALASSKNDRVSFLSRRIGGAEGVAPAVKISVPPRRPTDAAILRAIFEIEQRRSTDEKARMQQAAADMSGITQTVLDALREDISAEGFIEHAQQGNGPQGGVRAVASAMPFPTMASLVQLMERRRDAAEKLESDEILRMEAALAKAVDLRGSPAPEGRRGPRGANQGRGKHGPGGYRRRPLILSRGGALHGRAQPSGCTGALAAAASGKACWPAPTSAGLRIEGAADGGPKPHFRQ